MNKRIILSLGMLIVAGAVVAGGTGAFFADTETSAANVFTAGAVDITIDGLTHTYNGAGQGDDVPTFNGENGISFELGDLKPLDYGEVGYTLANATNDAIVCAMVEETGNAENGRIDPEVEAGDTTGGSNNTGVGKGELQDFMSFNFGGQFGALSDIEGQWFSVGDLNSGDTLGAAVGYCFGDFNNDGGCVETSNPTDVNVAQTDSMTADIVFKAVQKRNNLDFTCDEWNDGGGENGEGVENYEDPHPDTYSITRFNNDGGAEATFGTIQAAIDDVDTSDDDIIYVPAGTYGEDVRINKNITLLGAGPGSTIINGQGGSYAIELKGGVNGVKITGFTVNGSNGQEALKIEQSSANSNVTVEHNKLVSGANGHAVYAGNLINSDFNNNIFTIASGEPVILVYIAASGNNVNFDGNTFSGDLGAHLAFGSVAGNSTFKNNDFSAITAVGKDKLVEFIGVSADASAGGNVYPVISGNQWSTVNGGTANFKGVYRGSSEINSHSGSGDIVTMVN